MGFTPPYESGELALRDGHLEDRQLPTTSGRPNYAPDNRKVPPEPFLVAPFRDTDSEADPPSVLPTDGVAIDAEQATFTDSAGQVMPGSIIIQFTHPVWWGPASHMDVYAADTADFDADCFVKIGRIAPGVIGKADSYVVTSHHLQRGRTYDIAVVPVNADGAGIDPVDAPRGTVTLDSAGETPPDVAGFDATAVCCDLYAVWTPVTSDRKDVTHYEIRQGATYDTGTLVCRVWGWNVGKVVVNREAIPLALSAPNDQFHIKAVTGLGAVSETEDSDTLTATEIACLDAPCCVKAREITPPGGVDTFLVTSLTPSPGQRPVVNPGHGANGGGPPAPGIPWWVDPASFTPNGDLWDYTIIFADTTVGTEVLPLTESTPK